MEGGREERGESDEEGGKGESGRRKGGRGSRGVERKEVDGVRGSAVERRQKERGE